MIDDDSGDPHVLATASKIGEVTLVIPGRNCAATLDRCLQSVVPLMQSGELKEIIFVDDGSTDTTPEIAARYPVRVITGGGQGPGAARNLGWRAAQSELIWFIDSDCVAHPDALQQLLPHLSEPEVAGVGGSYSNLFPESLLATLIHEEIVARHRSMLTEVNFLGGFNVIYRRIALEHARGFDERDVNGPRAPGAEDCDLSFRLHQAGHSLRVENSSVVGHHHPRSLRRYIRSQRIHGHWRVRLYRRHLGRMGGDSYSGPADHLQPVSGLFAVCGLLFIPFSPIVASAMVSGCVLVNLACTLVIFRRLQMQLTSAIHLTSFCALSCVRSVWRGIGIASGMLSCLRYPPQSVEALAQLEEGNENGIRVFSGADGNLQEKRT
ncbi:MAG: glycosyltransferase [Fuerstiella sp.]|nr:glycosyltransferase [Fuerstiella sp.]